MNTIKCDVCIIGCGSGGIGAAIAAAEHGADTVVIDRHNIVGGTVTMSWVHSWEPSCGNPPLARKLWEKMRSYPYGAQDCEFTTCSRGRDGRKKPPMPFEQWAYIRAVEEEFSRFPNLRFFAGTEFISSHRDGRKITAVTCRSFGVLLEIKAKIFIDASADIVLCREAGCGCSIGEDAKSEYNEPDAPEAPRRDFLNEVNWLFRVSTGNKDILIDSSPVPVISQSHGMALIPLPNGDAVVNICGKGQFHPEREEDHVKVFREQFKIAYDWYRWQVISGRHSDWKLIGFAPELGIRETYRLKARYILNQNDIKAGYRRQQKRGFIGATDHRLDVHGTKLAFHTEYFHPIYGIPYECIQAVEYDNLLAACRGLGVSHLAAGSCRLSRVIMNIGCAAGRAAAKAALSGIMLEDIDPEKIADYEEPQIENQAIHYNYKSKELVETVQ